MKKKIYTFNLGWKPWKWSKENWNEKRLPDVRDNTKLTRMRAQVSDIPIEILCTVFTTWMCREETIEILYNFILCLLPAIVSISISSSYSFYRIFIIQTFSIRSIIRYIYFVWCRWFWVGNQIKLFLVHLLFIGESTEF